MVAAALRIVKVDADLYRVPVNVPFTEREGHSQILAEKSGRGISHSRFFHLRIQVAEKTFPNRRGNVRHRTVASPPHWR